MSNRDSFGYGLIYTLNNDKVASDCLRHLYTIPALKQIDLSSIFNKKIFLVTCNVVFTHYFYPISLFDDTRNNSAKCIK